MKATDKYGIRCNGEIYIDTTGISDNLFSSEINKRIYAKEGYVIYFKDGIFKKKYDENGKISKIQNLTVDDIDSNYINELKPKFENIKKQYGQFYIENIPLFNNKGNEIHQEIKSYHIRFDSLLFQTNVIDYINKDLQLQCDFGCSSSFPNIKPNERSLDGWSKERDILTNNPGTFYDMNFHKRGFGWNIYSLKMPLAWEICTGDSEIVVSIYDVFGDELDDPHPDLPINRTTGDNGNWILLDGTNNADGIAITTYPPSYDLDFNGG